VIVCHHDIPTTKVLAVVLIGATNYIIVHVISNKDISIVIIVMK
jgi:hypothetical protein